MVNVVVVNGFPRSGKDTFVKFCEEYLGAYCFSISTVDLVKAIATKCGWNGEKTPKNRKFLSDLKKLLVEWNDVPWKEVEKVYEIIKNECFTYQLKDSDFFLFIFSREPEEIERFKEEYGAITVLIDRTEIEGEQSNQSDRDIMNYIYDYTIDNNGTLEELADKAYAFVESVKITNKTREYLYNFEKNEREEVNE